MKWTLLLSSIFLVSPVFSQTNPSPSEQTESLKVVVKIGTAVENHEATGVADSFPATTAKIAGWSRITGATQPTKVIHIWKRDGKEVSRAELKVQSPSYRTYSMLEVKGRTGKWTLEVQNLDGDILASKDFEIK